MGRLFWCSLSFSYLIDLETRLFSPNQSTTTWLDYVGHQKNAGVTMIAIELSVLRETALILNLQLPPTN